MRVATTRLVRFTDAVLNAWDRVPPVAQIGILAVLAISLCVLVSRIF